MDPVARYKEYQEAFEVFFKNDDPKTIEPYFTENAVYETLADAPFAARHEGRDAIVAALQGSLNQMDRNFGTRVLEISDYKNENGVSRASFHMTLTLPDTPSLVLTGEELATFEGDRIVRLEDRIAPDVVKEAGAWLGAHGAKLG